MSANMLWDEQWAVHASVSARQIERRLRIAMRAPADDERAAAAAAVSGHVQEVQAACRRTGRGGRRGLRDRWRGTSVERAYRNLHAAKVFLVDVLPAADVDAVVPDVTTRLGLALDRNDPRRVEAERMLATTAGRARRAVVRQAMETGYDASDEEYVRLRDFRNIVVKAAVAITALTALLVGLIALAPDAVPFCFDPGATAPAPGDPATYTVCAGGERTAPAAVDVLVVAGLGAVGGLLGALVAIRNLRGTSTPYPVSTALAVLKVPAGALTGIIGMLLLAADFIPGLTNLDNQPQILAYALVFGIAQQLVTRVADGRAQQILDHLPSKDPQARSAEPPAVPLPPAPGTPQGGPSPAPEPDGLGPAVSPNGDAPPPDDGAAVAPDRVLVTAGDTDGDRR